MHKSLIPVVRIFLAGMLLLGGLEILARSSWSENHFTVPSMGFNDNAFDVQMIYLDQMLKQDGKIDCIIVGSSVVEPSLQPSVIDEAFTTYHPNGKSFKCFNFGRWGMHNDVATQLIRILIDKYNPNYIIYGLNPMALNPFNSASDKLLLNSQWFKYMQGEYSILGWLIENTALSRYILRYKNWLDKDFKTSMRQIEMIQQVYEKDGYRGLNFESIDVHYGVGDFISDKELFKERISTYDSALATSMIDFGLTPLRKTTFENTLELNGYKGTQLIILEMPTHASFTDFFRNGQVQYHKYLTDMRAMAENYDVVYWQLPSIDLIPDEFWFDRHHIHIGGGYLLSYWLGAQLAVSSEQNFADNIQFQPPLAEIDIPALEDTFDLPWGLAPANYIEYQQTIDDISLFPDIENTVIFNPNGLSENTNYLQINIGLAQQYGSFSKVEQQRDYIHLYILDQIQNEDDLDLSPIQAKSLADWTDSYHPNLLLAADIDYIFYSMSWWSTLSVEAQRALENPTYYKHVRTIANPNIGSTYMIYQPIVQQSP